MATEKVENLIAPIEETAINLPATTLLEKSINRIDSNSPKTLKPVLKLAHDYLTVPLEAIERKAHSYPVLNSVHRVTKIPPITFFGVLSLAVILVFRRIYRSNAHLLSNIIGVLYPAYASIRAIEAPNPDDDERWLTYWSVFGLFALADHSSATIRKYFPVYFTFKIAGLYWLAHRNGSLDVYRRVVRPILVKYSKRKQSFHGTKNNVTHAA